jgi:hypothetical protein
VTCTTRVPALQTLIQCMYAPCLPMQVVARIEAHEQGDAAIDPEEYERLLGNMETSMHAMSRFIRWALYNFGTPLYSSGHASPSGRSACMPVALSQHPVCFVIMRTPSYVPA